MLKELIQFTETVLADPVFRNLNLAPREGLQIVLEVNQTPEGIAIALGFIFNFFLSPSLTAQRLNLNSPGKSPGKDDMVGSTAQRLNVTMMLANNPG